jgi:hypothetical protein
MATRFMRRQPDTRRSPSAQPPSRRSRRGHPALRAPLAAVVALGSLMLGPRLAPASATATPNPVITWDSNAQAAIWDGAHQQPNVQARSFAIVHGAIYDAVNAIAGTPYHPYLVAPPARRTDSMDAAVATAAYRTLVWMFPEQRSALQAQYDQSLAAVPDGAPKRGGVGVGAAAAAAMIAARTNDGAFGPQTWAVGTQPGQWRPTPPAFASDGAWSGHVKPFLLPSASMFRTAGPPPLTSTRYARDINEVKAIGAVNSPIRTADQTQAAIWWHDRHLAEWEIKRQIATSQHLGPLQAARMFALVDLTDADTTIACFAEKEAWMRWRPVTAIQLADTDGNPATEADPTWTPLLVTPPHPDYTSGHTCFTAATLGALASFFHTDKMSFSAYSADSGTTRHFTSFSQAVAEVIEARIWGGIHTRTADVQGAKIGAQVAGYVSAHYFKPSR